ncbi:MAG: MarR family transcriptional regulator [Candidatus Microsaccharimonas sossegonensis]|uniref:MarR family transcriptional regulator n=1 Tax=Candidatus Microsaccharimonas sossegonensis TaxID=2506948 RepID=A0A4V1J7D3_9BACT|nr:MAG: MarR family transcriptional regulator [Candidatus Microsaccharimonas sossegonensis]
MTINFTSLIKYYGMIGKMNKTNNYHQKDLAQITTYQSGIAQASAHRIINRVVSDYLLRYDLSAMQWCIIGYIHDAGDTGVTLTELGRVLGTSFPYTTNVITLLESKGVISKKVHVKDSRIKLVTVNKEYEGVVDDIEAGLRDELRKSLYNTDNISREELQTYIRVLYKIIAAGN